MKERRLVFVYSPEVERLTYPPDCPFKSQRAGLTRQRLQSFGLLDQKNRLEHPARQASRTELEWFHEPRYLDELKRAEQGDLSVEGFAMGLGGPDTPVFPAMFAFGAWACGAALVGADLLIRGDADVVFSLLGGFHHAKPAKAAGFCYLNDAVLACLCFSGAGLRVAYLDVDAHHGDGVQECFYRRADVLTISIHESGRTLFPWSGFEDEIGEGNGKGFNVNVPLPAGAYDDVFLLAFRRVALPILQAYSPDVIVVELGMDILAGDPLTHMRMTNNVVVDLIKDLLAFERPILFLGGGGYHVENTVRAWALAWRTACDADGDDAAMLGLGGVMMGSSEWVGGLRDRELPVTDEE
ncbi:MAG: acetoin utilization protein AcuC, partial [Verrucomicrobiae bacterium]|nr:acetoin utilization protein AcuC [Verrucomicrobiae bacterium]